MSRATLATTITTGPATAVVGARAAGLIDVLPDDDRFAALLEIVADGGGFDDVLAALADAGLSDLPSFGFVFDEERGVRAISRGDVRVQIAANAPLDSSILSGPNLRTWREVAIPAARSWALHLVDDESEAAEPLESGLAAAARVAGWVTDDEPEDVGEEPTDDQPVMGEEAAPAWSPPPLVTPPANEPPVTEPVQFPAGPATSELEPTQPWDDEDSSVSEDGSIEAVMCPDGHANPPGSPNCRQCGAAITDQSVTSISRPDLGLLVWDSGRTVSLDKPVLIGRNPPDGVEIDGEIATPFRVPDPDAVLSRQHLEVRLVGWDVVLTDKKSRNFTTVTRPGEAPERLLPGVPSAIPLGTKVVLADIATFTYEPPS